MTGKRSTSAVVVMLLLSILTVLLPVSVMAMDITGEKSGTYAVGIKTIKLSSGFNVFSLELEPKIPYNASLFQRNVLRGEPKDLYYFSQKNQVWMGHPGYLPENINNDEVILGKAYITFIDTENQNINIIGI